MEPKKPKRILIIDDEPRISELLRRFCLKLGHEHAFEILHQGRGKQFEPRLVDCFMACTYEVEAIQQRFSADSDDLLPLRIRCAAGREDASVPTQRGG